MNIEIAQIITQIISFLVMLWVLKRYAWRPLLTALEERRDRIKTEFENIAEEKKGIENLRNQLNDQLQAIDDQANSQIKEAIKEGKKISQDIQEKAHLQAKNIITKAQEELQKEIERAKEQLKDELVTIVITATEKIVDSQLDEDKQRKLIHEFVNQMRFN